MYTEERRVCAENEGAVGEPELGVFHEETLFELGF